MLSRNKKTIWTITVCSEVKPVQLPDGRFADYNEHGAMRTWGFYFDKQDALNVIRENMTNLWEYLYDYAILEEYEEGISCNIPESTQWFKFDKQTETYAEIERPAGEEHCCSYALG